MLDLVVTKSRTKLQASASRCEKDVPNRSSWLDRHSCLLLEILLIFVDFFFAGLFRRGLEQLRCADSENQIEPSPMGCFSLRIDSCKVVMSWTPSSSMMTDRDELEKPIRHHPEPSGIIWFSVLAALRPCRLSRLGWRVPQQTVMWFS